MPTGRVPGCAGQGVTGKGDSEGKPYPSPGCGARWRLGSTYAPPVFICPMHRNVIEVSRRRLMVAWSGVTCHPAALPGSAFWNRLGGVPSRWQLLAPSRLRLRHNLSAGRPQWLLFRGSRAGSPLLLTCSDPLCATYQGREHLCYPGCVHLSPAGELLSAILFSFDFSLPWPPAHTGPPWSSARTRSFAPSRTGVVGIDLGNKLNLPLTRYVALGKLLHLSELQGPPWVIISTKWAQYRSRREPSMTD